MRPLLLTLIAALVLLCALIVAYEVVRRLRPPTQPHLPEAGDRDRVLPPQRWREDGVAGSEDPRGRPGGDDTSG